MNNIKSVKITKDDRVFNIRLTRRELITLLIACSAGNVRSGKEWKALHAKLKHYITVIDLNDRGGKHENK